jgi:hypothetical protein
MTPQGQYARFARNIPEITNVFLDTAESTNEYYDAAVHNSPTVVSGVFAATCVVDTESK